MDAMKLADRIFWGLNVAARIVGSSADAFRPNGPMDPLAASNRFLRLHAAFAATDGRFGKAATYGNLLWNGLFDAAYTRPGDYLVQNDATWFIASQQHLMPVLCVQTTRVVSLSRPSVQSSSGINSYGGVTAEDRLELLANWPAGVLASAGEGRSLASLPSDTSVPYWTVLLPACAGVVLRPTDLMSDDLGRNAVVSTAELTNLGWRLTVKQAIT